MGRTLFDYLKRGGIQDRVFCDIRRHFPGHGQRGANYWISSVHRDGFTSLMMDIVYADRTEGCVNVCDHLQDPYVRRRY